MNEPPPYLLELTEPTTKAGTWLVERSRWDVGMRGFFVRINATAGPEDMLRHVLAIEAEAVAAERARLREAVRGLEWEAWEWNQRNIADRGGEILALLEPDHD